MNLSQIAFSFFNLKIYGVLFSILFLGICLLIYRDVKRKKFPVNEFVHFFWKCVIGGLLVSFLFSAVMDSLGVFMRPEKLLFFWEQRLYGIAFFFGFFGILWYETRQKQFGFLRWADLFTPFILQAMVIEGVIAFITGYRYGIISSLPWAVRYETIGVETIYPVHPTPLYGSILFLCIWASIKQKKNRWEKSGKSVALFAAKYVLIADFLLHFISGTPSREFWGIFRVEQVFVLLGFVLVLLIEKYCQAEKNT